jgi:hypothetical protein
VTEPPKDLAEEVHTGRSERTPWLALTGVTAVITLVVCAVLLAAFLVYYFA